MGGEGGGGFIERGTLSFPEKRGRGLLQQEGGLFKSGAY